jgi:hypothetical protein
MPPLQKHFQIEPYEPTDIVQPATGTTQSLGVVMDREGSSCQLVGGGFTITAGGFEVAAGNGLIRAANSLDSPRRYVEWAAHEFLLAELTDDSANHVYHEWNGGAPRLVVDPVGRYDGDPNTNIWLGEVWREGAKIYLHPNRGIRTGMQAGHNRHRLIETRNQEYVLGEYPRVFTNLFPKIAVGANSFWYGGVRRDLVTEDTNAGYKFDYYFLDNTGDWNEIQDQTDIDLVHFDDGTAVPGAAAPAGHLAGGHFGVHWIFQGTNGALHVLFGRADYPLLTDAINAAVPGDQPEIFMWHASLVGQVIVQEGAVAFALIRQATDTAFAAGAADDYAAVTAITFEAGSYYKNASVRGTVACDGQPARAVAEVQQSRALIGWKVATKALATLMLHASGCARR